MKLSGHDTVGPVTSRRLIVIRHADAEPAALTDYERHLTAKGRDDATEAGHWLADVVAPPLQGVVSGATRARQTWSALMAGAGWDPPVAYERSLFTAGPDTALDLLRQTSDEVTTLVAVGHNPTMAYLAQLLDDGDGEAGAVERMATGFPTCSVAVFACETAWSMLDAGGCRLIAFHVGRA